MQKVLSYKIMKKQADSDWWNKRRWTVKLDICILIGLLLVL